MTLRFPLCLPRWFFIWAMAGCALLTAPHRSDGAPARPPTAMRIAQGAPPGAPPLDPRGMPMWVTPPAIPGPPAIPYGAPPPTAPPWVSQATCSDIVFDPTEDLARIDLLRREAYGRFYNAAQQHGSDDPITQSARKEYECYEMRFGYFSSGSAQ
jgi:hypothetical protein